MKHFIYHLAVATAIIGLTPSIASAQTSTLEGTTLRLQDSPNYIHISPNGLFSVHTDSAQTEQDQPASPTTLYSPYAPKATIYNSENSMFRVSMEKEPSRDPSAPAKKKWFFEMPDSLMGRYFLALTRLAEVPGTSAFTPHLEMAKGMCYFELSPDKKFIYLKQYSESARCDTVSNIRKAVDISNNDPIVCVFKIENHNKGLYKIEVSNMLLSNQIMNLDNRVKQVYNIGPILPDRSTVMSLHCYPTNLEIHTQRTYNVATINSIARDGFATIGLNTSLILLPKEPMQPRLSDPRVGFQFSSAPLFSDNQQQVSVARYILRWRLEPKSQEDAQLQKQGTPVEPLKPIVFYIDPAFPAQWHPYIKEGVAQWQKAFEQAGWKNAIYALDWPKNDSTASMEDARYNVIRYVASTASSVNGSEGAFDYRSGEILNTHIYFYGGTMREMRANYVANCGAVDENCHTSQFPESLMGALIRHGIARAVASTLGLHTNNLSSTLTPTESLRSKSYLQQYGMSPSITDQLPYNFVAQPEDHLTQDELIPRVGDADYWTIEWGYKLLPYTDPEAERHFLTEYTTEHLAANPRHQFAYNNSYAPDPHVQPYDLGDNQALAISYGIKNLKRIAPHLIEWGSSNADFQYSMLNSRLYFSKINEKLLEYHSILNNDLSGRHNRLIPASAEGAEFYYEPKEFCDQALDGIFDMIGQQPSWVNADASQRFDCPLPERVGLDYATLLASQVQPTVLANLNPNMGLYDYLMRFYDHIYGSLTPGAAPDLYQRTQQAAMLTNCIASFDAKYDSFVKPQQRPACISILTKIQQKLRSLLSAAPDSTTRQHYTLLLRQVDNFFTVE